ncbi:MAG: DEAD/DEAH box helicase [Gammaproteobacteria bacterium]|nr:DEAD/DEAH box helicase [Gammaproteobacteria bacterium]
MHESFAGPWGRLSAPARLLAQTYGVIAPYAMGMKQVQHLMAQANVRLAKRPLGIDRIRRCNSELIQAGIVAKRFNEGVEAMPQWSLALTRAAHEAGNLRPLLAAALEHFRYYPGTEDGCEMRLRCYLVAGELTRLEQMATRQELSPDVWWFLAAPFAADLIDTLPGTLRTHALRGCLEFVIDTAAPAEALIEACAAADVDRTALAAEVAFVRVLQGRLDSAEAELEDLPPDRRARKPARTGLASIRALIAVLRGDDGEAQQRIAEALTLERAGTRKRLVFPDCRAFALSLLGLVRSDTPLAAELLDQVFRGAKRTQAEWPVELGFVSAASAVKSGREVYLPHRFRYSGLGALVDGLLACWTDDFPDDWQEQMAPLLHYRERAAANGFLWISAECDEVLRRAGGDGGEGAAEGETQHTLLGTATLATLAAPMPEWEFSLKGIERLAREARGDAARKRKAAAPARRRLAWILNDDGYDIQAYPREQRQQKNGKWTKGRKMSLQRLVQNSGKMDFLLPQDLEAAGSASMASQWRGWDKAIDEQGVHALAGHPHVFDESGQPIEIARREPELFISEAEGGSIRATVRPYAEDIGDAYRSYFIAWPTARRCEVTRFTEKHVRLFAFIPEEGLQLPAEARSRLLSAVSALAGEVRVQSDAAGDTTAAQRVDADPAPCVRLEPFEDGLSIAVVAEPIRDSGIFFEPGKGAATVFGRRGGHSVQARRDFSAEGAALNHLLESCPRLAPPPTELEPLMLTGSADCLELLEALEDSGARCIWPKGEPFRIVERASAPSLALSIKSAGEWLQASGKLAFDKERALDLKQLFELLEANPGARFVQLGKGEFLALSSGFRRQLDDFASLSAPAAKGAVRLHSLAALSLGSLMEEADLTADDGWRELCANVEAAQSFEPELPSTLQAELRPYQIEGYRWLARLARWGAGACLTDDMGLGKTVQAIALLLARAPNGPALVVAPTSVVANWVDEARRFAPTLNVTVCAGAAEHRARLMEEPGSFDLFVTTYGLLHNDIDLLGGIRWRSVVLDEAQAIKNPATKRARAARRLSADFRLVTTGTPIQNNLMDLYSLFSFINPGLLGSAQQFRRNFGGGIENSGEDAGAKARLRRLIAPFVLRRLKSQVLDDLPERTEIVLHVKMSTEEATLYEALRQRAVEELEAGGETGPDSGEGARRVQVLAHLTRLRLACCNPRLVMDGAGGGPQPPRSSKLETFAGVLSELIQNRHKVLVFSQFVKHLKLVEEHLAGAGVAYQYLDGVTPAKVRAERINAFQAGYGEVFLISLRAGGVGLNLTAADYVIHLDPWWNPAVEDQASDRAHRIGQTRPVTIYRLVTEGTIEEQIVDLHHRKRDLADRLLEGADTAARLTAEELLALLRQPLETRGRP